MKILLFTLLAPAQTSVPTITLEKTMLLAATLTIVYCSGKQILASASSQYR